MFAVGENYRNYHTVMRANFRNLHNVILTQYSVEIIGILTNAFLAKNFVKVKVLLNKLLKS